MKMKLVTVFAILIIRVSLTNDIYASPSGVFQQFDKTTIIKKKLSDAEKQISNGSYTLAYSYLSTANKYKKLVGDLETYLRTLEDKNKYDDIIKSTDVTKVRQYMNSLATTSQYYKSASNHLALLLEKSLSGYSSEYMI